MAGVTVGTFIFDTLANADAYLSSLQTAMDLSIAYTDAQEHPATNDDRAYVSISDDIPSDFRLDFISFTGLLSNTPKTEQEVVNEGFPVQDLFPLLLPNLGMYIVARSQDTTPEGGAAISQWDDLSGNGNNFVQATGVKQPLFTAAQKFGSAAVIADGANDFMQAINAAFIQNLNDFTIGIVFEVNAATVQNLLGSGTAVNLERILVLYRGDLLGQVRFAMEPPTAGGSLDIVDTSTIPTGQFVRLLIRRDATGTGQYTIKVNGVTDGTGATNALARDATPQDLDLFNNRVETNPSDAKILEAFWYTDAKTDDELDSLDAAWVSKYNFDNSQVLPTLTPTIDKVSVSADDQLSNTLFDKIATSGDIIPTIVNPGVNEQIELNSNLTATKHLEISGATIFGNVQPVVSPAQITANQNDYNPASLATAGILRLDSDAGYNITGIAAQLDNTILYVVNTTTFDLAFTNEDALSAAANRFVLNADLTLKQNHSMCLWYDGTTTRWRVLSVQIN